VAKRKDVVGETIIKLIRLMEGGQLKWETKPPPPGGTKSGFQAERNGVVYSFFPHMEGELSVLLPGGGQKAVVMVDCRVNTILLPPVERQVRTFRECEEVEEAFAKALSIISQENPAPPDADSSPEGSDSGR